jgi:hypothetical protein
VHFAHPDIINFCSHNVATLTLKEKFWMRGDLLASYFGSTWPVFDQQLFRLKKHGTTVTRAPQIRRQGNSATGPVFQRNNARVSNTVVDEDDIPVPDAFDDIDLTQVNIRARRLQEQQGAAVDQNDAWTGEKLRTQFFSFPLQWKSRVGAYKSVNIAGVRDSEMFHDL